MNELDGRVKVLIRILLVLIFILVTICIVMLANFIYKKTRPTVKVEETEDEDYYEESEMSPDEFESYEDYKDYKMFSSSSIYLESGSLDDSLNDVLSYISKNYNEKTGNLSYTAFTPVDYTEFNMQYDKQLGLSKDFLNRFTNVFINDSLTVVGLFDKYTVVFAYGDSLDELLVVTFNKSVDGFGILYELGTPNYDLGFNTEGCAYDEYKQYKILYIKG